MNATDKYLSELSQKIYEMHKGKKLEKYLAEVFRKIPGVRQVKENGSSWRSDNGADLIITMNYSLGNIVELGHIIIVQVKSYDGEHYDTTAVEQVKKGIQTYNASAGMLITTAKKNRNIRKCSNKSKQRSRRSYRIISIG